MTPSDPQPERARAGRLDNLSRHRRGIERAIYLLSLLGILVVVHLWIQQGINFSRGCLGFSAPQPTAECNVVTTSSAGTLFGIPNVWWGGFFYVLMALLTAAAAYWATQTDRLRWIKQSRAGLVLFGFVYSVYLFFYQYTVLDTFCVLCLVSAGIVVALLIVHLFDIFSAPSAATTTSTAPASSAAASTSSATSASSPSSSSTRSSAMNSDFALYSISAVLVILLAGADIWYFDRLEAPPAATAEQFSAEDIQAGLEAATDEETVEPEQTTPPAPATAECSYDESAGVYEDYQSLVDFSDAFKGSSQAPVMVIEFFDPNCPHCKSLHPIMQDMIEEHGDVAQFVMKPFPVFQYSFPQILALRVAAQENKFFEMLEQQFAMQQRGSGLSVSQLQGIARDIGMDPQSMVQEMRSQTLQQQVMTSYRTIANEVNIQSVPAVMINGRIVARSSRTSSCLSELIEEAATTDSAQ